MSSSSSTPVGQPDLQPDVTIVVATSGEPSIPFDLSTLRSGKAVIMYQQALALQEASRKNAASSSSAGNQPSSIQ